MRMAFFNVADSLSFVCMTENSMKYAKKSFTFLQSYKAPSLTRLSGNLLNQAYKSIEQLVAPLLTVAKKYWATIFFRLMKLSWLWVVHTRKRQESSEQNRVGQCCKLVQRSHLRHGMRCTWSPCNWYAHGHIHTKILNRLDPATTEKLVYVYANNKLVASTLDAEQLKIFAWDIEWRCLGSALPAFRCLWTRPGQRRRGAKAHSYSFWREARGASRGSAPQRALANPCSPSGGSQGCSQSDWSLGTPSTSLTWPQLSHHWVSEVDYVCIGKYLISWCDQVCMYCNMYCGMN